MTIPMAMLVICSFIGGAEYECEISESFNTFETCEEIAVKLAESKGLSAYCIDFEDEDGR